MGCCDEVGTAGLILLIIAVVLCFVYGLACVIFAILWFRSENRSYILIVIISIVGLFTLLGSIVAAFFSVDINAGYAGFAMVFIVLLVPLFLVVYAYRVEGKKSIVNLVILIATPAVMGVAAIGIMLLLVEDEKLGKTAMRYVLIVVIVIDFCYALGLFLCAVFFFVMSRKGEEAYSLPLLYLIGLVVGAFVALIGVIVACFFELNAIPAIVGLCLVLIVQAVVLAYLAVPYFLKDDDSRTWLKLVMIIFSALFSGVTLLGIIAAAVRIILDPL